MARDTSNQFANADVRLHIVKCSTLSPPFAKAFYAHLLAREDAAAFETIRINFNRPLSQAHALSCVLAGMIYLLSDSPEVGLTPPFFKSCEN